MGAKRRAPPPPQHTGELGDVVAVDQALHEHVVGLQVAVREAVGREVTVRVEVAQPARDLPQKLELGLVRKGVCVREHRGGEGAAPHGAVGAGLNAGLHREEVGRVHVRRLGLRAVHADHVRVLRTVTAGHKVSGSCHDVLFMHATHRELEQDLLLLAPSSGVAVARAPRHFDHRGLRRELAQVDLAVRGPGNRRERVRRVR